MQDHIPIINDDPAVAGESLFLALLLVLGADIFKGGVGERIHHTVTGAGADNKIIGK